MQILVFIYISTCLYKRSSFLSELNTSLETETILNIIIMREKYFRGRLTNSVNLYSIPKRLPFPGGGEKEIPGPLNKKFKPFLTRKAALQNIQSKYH